MILSIWETKFSSVCGLSQSWRYASFMVWKRFSIGFIWGEYGALKRIVIPFFLISCNTWWGQCDFDGEKSKSWMIFLWENTNINVVMESNVVHHQCLSPIVCRAPWFYKIEKIFRCWTPHELPLMHVPPMKTSAHMPRCWFPSMSQWRYEEELQQGSTHIAFPCLCSTRFRLRTAFVYRPNPWIFRRKLIGKLSFFLCFSEKESRGMFRKNETK